jgi:hypothetical protein
MVSHLFMRRLKSSDDDPLIFPLLPVEPFLSHVQSALLNPANSLPSDGIDRCYVRLGIGVLPTSSSP